MEISARLSGLEPREPRELVQRPQPTQPSAGAPAPGSMTAPQASHAVETAVETGEEPVVSHVMSQMIRNDPSIDVVTVQIQFKPSAGRPVERLDLQA